MKLVDLQTPSHSGFVNIISLQHNRALSFYSHLVFIRAAPNK
jgi:hypothetical protein